MNNFTRRDFLKDVGLGALGIALSNRIFQTSSAWAQQGQAKRPNFVFVFADDWGWGDLGCYGHPTIKTPNLDHLAKDGIRFTQFYVAGSVCSPSRTGIMTGQCPARLRVHGHFAPGTLNEQRGMPNWLDPTVPTVTRLLQQAGYVTGHFGKWHLGAGEGAPMPDAYGIDDSSTNSSNDKSLQAKMKERNPDNSRSQSTTVIVDEAIRFVEANKDKPFYVNVWLNDTHAVLSPTDEQMEPYKGLMPHGNSDQKGAMAIYYGAATDADKQLGRLFKKLDELGLKDDTVVIFSADNGPEDITVFNASHSGVGSPGPFRGRKRSLYEGGIRLPFIIRYPRMTPKNKVDNTTILGGVDFLPTICALAGVELPQDIKLDGQDMSPALLGKPTQRTGPLTWEWRFNVAGHVINKCPILAIREGKWKLLMNPDRSRVELYDIPADSSELNNLAEKHPDVVEKLSAEVLAWQKTLPPGPIDPSAGKNDYNWPKEFPAKDKKDKVADSQPITKPSAAD